jgi:iron complex outermembrane receptor protein
LAAPAFPLACTAAVLTLALPAAHAQQAALSSPAAIVEVVGRSEAGAYDANDAAGAKTTLPLRELPQSVRVVTRQAIDDLGATRLDEVLDHVGGVSRQNNFGGLWDNIAIRGLAGDPNVGMATLFNGFASGRGFNAPRDLAGVERIEFLKGTAAALYGSSEPGGTLNIVSKRPLWKPAHALETQAGRFGLRRNSLDSTGPIGESFAYRLNAAVEDRDSMRDHVGTARRVLAPTFSWLLSPDTSLDYTGEWLRHRSVLDRGVVAVDNRLGAIPRSRFLGEPADGPVTVENETHQLVLSHDWGPAWRSRVGLSHRRTSIDGFATEPSALMADGQLRRQRRFRDYDSDDLALQAELRGEIQAGGLRHDLLVGFEHYRLEMDMVMLRINPSAGSPYAIDIHHPVYGQPLPQPRPNTDTFEQQRNAAFYVQDAIALGRHWRVVAGLRQDRYRQNLLNRLTGASQAQSPSSTSPRLGLSWLPDARWTVYLNGGRSFRPNTGTDIAGQSFEPEVGRSVELGLKWERADRRQGATAALFDIRKRQVLTADASNPGYSVAAGQVRSRGLEFDWAGQLTRQWRVNASLAFNDVEVTRDHTLETGGRLLNVPRVTASLLAMHESTLASGQRLGLGGGVTHVGRRLGQARTQAEADQGLPAFDLPAYTTAKLVGYWRASPALRFTLEIDNLTDRTFYTSSYSRVWVTPGQARTVTLGLQGRF